jgi:hypothetical protein
LLPDQGYFVSRPYSDSTVLGCQSTLPPKTRSRVTNGTSLLADVDRRSQWARRFRDLISLHTVDLGGADMVSEGEKALIRRCAALNVELERMESDFAEAGAATLPALETYQRASNSLRRLLQALGLERRARDVGPTLSEILRGPPP